VFGGSLESGGQFCVGAFGRNLTSSNLRYVTLLTGLSNIKATSVAYDPSKLTEINRFALDSSTVYCSKIFANHIESTKFITFLFK
jgi:hypothetical protein